MYLVSLVPATEQMLDTADCLMVPICLPSRGEEIEDKEVIIQELEVGKNQTTSEEIIYSSNQGRIHTRLLLFPSN